MGCIGTKDENIVTIHKSQDIPDLLSGWSETDMIFFFEIDQDQTLPEVTKFSQALMDSFAEMKKTLRKLEIRPGKGRTSSDHFSKVLAAVKQLKSLEVLKINLSDSNPFHSSFNQIGDCLIQLPQLRDLTLDFRNQQYENIQYILHSINKNLLRLEINLANNQSVDDDFLASFESKIARLSFLREVDFTFDNTNITQQGIRELVVLFGKWNQQHEEGTVSMFLSFRNCQRLIYGLNELNQALVNHASLYAVTMNFNGSHLEDILEEPKRKFENLNLKRYSLKIRDTYIDNASINTLRQSLKNYVTDVSIDSNSRI